MLQSAVRPGPYVALPPLVKPFVQSIAAIIIVVCNIGLWLQPARPYLS
jgi:hypothetical protein